MFGYTIYNVEINVLAITTFIVNIVKTVSYRLQTLYGDRERYIVYIV